VTKGAPPRDRPAAAAYQVIDRELLLPAYKRFIVEPLLPAIPATVHPNTLTHAAHLCCLTAAALLSVFQPSSGWLLILAMLLLNAYVWLDNADGGHARRTGRASLYGEVLDHGLDIWNAAYMGLILARTLGAGAGWTVIVAGASTASMAVNIWEQAQTGVFQLGRIQQVEFAFALSVVMIASAWLGTDYWAGIVVGPVTLQAVLLACVPLAVCSGMVQNVLRVRKAAAPWLAVFGYLLLVVGLMALGARGDLPALAAVLLVTLVSGGFGARMLLHRVRREPARIGASYIVWATLLWLALALGASRGTALLSGLMGLFYAAAASRAAWALRAAAGAADQSAAKGAAAGAARAGRAI
jgi:phosphatidylglycerophosphate synthase